MATGGTMVQNALGRGLVALGLWLGVATASPAAETVVYYHTDALGSPVAMTDAGGTVIEHRTYEPYGKQLSPLPPQDGPGYTGHVYDAATGLNYMQQRYYDPGIGRFLSVDPVTANSGTGANFNRYWYANNNPYKFTDPDGRVALSIPAGLATAMDRILKPVRVEATAALTKADNKAINAFSKSIGLGREALVKSGNTNGLLASIGTDHVYRQSPTPLVANLAQKQGVDPAKIMGYRDPVATTPTIVALPRFSELADRSITTPDYHGMELGRGGDQTLTKGYLHELGHVVDESGATSPAAMERNANDFVDDVLED